MTIFTRAVRFDVGIHSQESFTFSPSDELQDATRSRSTAVSGRVVELIANVPPCCWRRQDVAVNLAAGKLHFLASAKPTDCTNATETARHIRKYHRTAVVREIWDKLQAAICSSSLFLCEIA